MKFSAATLFLLAGYASAGSQYSLTLKDGGYDSVRSALSPSLTYSGESNGMEYGSSVDLSSSSCPYSVWGQKKYSVGEGWTIKARSEYSKGKYDYDGDSAGTYITVEGSDADEETFVWGSGVVGGKNVKALKVGAKKIINTDGGKFMVAPRHSFETSETHVCLGFTKDDTKAYLTLSEDEKSFLVQQQLDDDNSASVKAGCSGFVAATMTNESDLGSTTVTVTPDDIDVEIKSDGWVAGIKSALSLDAEPTVRFSKSLTFGV
ncbi:unnamed protein product [Pseudo-nitzschia multistriata]|uniref:Uncharacterized protein n=1 Tax=Pseudo-nitzschia multistriata TaxID=183589 RepID=A0A448YW30_9STRA|nr:unnamed protein product [Pseudo-nitzschia multistriata]